MPAEQLDESVLEEKSYDRKWIVNNLHLFVPLAQEGFQRMGRGAILANLAELILRKHYEEGHPFNYHAASEDWLDADEFAEENTRLSLHRLLDTYTPESEFVLVLVKAHRAAIHRFPLPPEGETDFEIRGAYVNAEAEERHNRLTCTDFWAREYRLTSPYTLEWLYRVSGPEEL
jgi:hypothetical protein